MMAHKRPEASSHLPIRHQIMLFPAAFAAKSEARRCARPRSASRRCSMQRSPRRSSFCVRCRLLALRRMTVCCLLWRSGQLRPSWRPMCPLRPKSPRTGPACFMVPLLWPRAYRPQLQHRMTRRFLDRM